MKRVRRPAVAGIFYPGQAKELEQTVDTYINEAVVENGQHTRAIIAPHAGYVYSGSVAGVAYAFLRRTSPQPDRIILMGPSHRVLVNGLAASSADYFETPLGSLRVDTSSVEEAVCSGFAVIDDEAHEAEHSLEVQLPFIQRAFPQASIVPLLVGRADPEGLAKSLEVLVTDDSTVIVVSSDLSHYHPYDKACQEDSKTSQMIERLDYEALAQTQACGAGPVKGLLYYARQKGLSVKTVCLTNSGDTAGTRDRVVGYGAYVFCAE